MNITRNYPGLKTVMLLYYLISIFSLISCRKEAHYPDEYTILLNNQYFENLDSVSVDSAKRFDEVLVNEIAVLPHLEPGEHSFKLYTHSGLILGFKLTLAGAKDNLSQNVH